LSIGDGTEPIEGAGNAPDVSDLPKQREALFEELRSAMIVTSGLWDLPQASERKRDTADIGRFAKESESLLVQQLCALEVSLCPRQISGAIEGLGP
jgi:hypothetical protein